MSTEELHPLDEWVFDDGKIVTYKLFSQIKGITSSHAQRCAAAPQRRRAREPASESVAPG